MSQTKKPVQLENENFSILHNFIHILYIGFNNFMTNIVNE